MISGSASGARRGSNRWLVAAVAAGLLLGALDAYLVAGVLLPMVSDVGVPLSHLERATPVVSVFLIGYVAAIPVFGPLSDLRGRVVVYLGALLLFAAGSALTASAGELDSLVAGRAVQGFAGGALVPVSLAIVADLFPGRAARALALGVVAGAQELGSVAGPVYGAAVSQWAAALGGWRAVFWLNLPLAALCGGWFLFAWRRAAPQAPRPAAAALAELRKPSGPAAGLFLGGGMALLVVALYPTDAARGLFNANFVPLLAAAAGLLAAFLVLQRGRSLLVRSPLAAGVNFLVGAALVAALAEVPVLASTLFGLDQTGAALLLTRFLAGVPLGALLGGWLTRFDRRLPAAGGLALAALCFWRMSGWTGLDASATPVLLGCGLGFGLVIAPVVSAILDAAAADEHGAASAIAVLARSAGMVVGIALLAAYGFHRFYSGLAACPSRTIFGIRSVDLACAGGAVRGQFHDVFVIAAGICVIAALLSLTLVGARRPL